MTTACTRRRRGGPWGRWRSSGPTPRVKVLVRHAGMGPGAGFREAVIAGAVGTRAIPTWTLDGLVEVGAAGVSKARPEADGPGAGHRARADVIAFGDMPNDLPMMPWAGTSYAMANAHPDVRSAADSVAPSHDEDGVAVVLERVFGL